MSGVLSKRSILKEEISPAVRVYVKKPLDAESSDSIFSPSPVPSLLKLIQPATWWPARRALLLMSVWMRRLDVPPLWPRIATTTVGRRIQWTICRIQGRARCLWMSLDLISAEEIFLFFKSRPRGAVKCFFLGIELA